MLAAMRVRAAIRWSLVAALSLGGAHEAAAQRQMLSSLFPEGVPGYDATPGVTVRSRLHPELAAAGIAVGALRIFPGLDIATAYNSNVLGNAGGGGRGSWQVTTSPSLSVTSDWSRNQVGASVSLESTQYLAMPAQNQTGGTVAAGARLDVGRDQVVLAAAHSLQHETAGTVNTLASTRPVSVQIDDVRLGYTLAQGRWSLTPALNLSSWSYGDAVINGATTSQAYRDRIVTAGDMTLRYELAPLRNILFVLRALGQTYVHVPAGQATSNSQSYQALAGLDYGDAVWRWRLLLGGESRQFAAPAYQPRTTFIAEAEATWFPTQLTTLHLTLSRDTEDAAQEGVAGLIYSAARLSIDHELLRNVLLRGYVGLQQATYFSGGQQTGYTAGAGLTWSLNRSMRLSVTYDQSDLRGGQNSTQTLSTGYSRGLSLVSFHLGL